MSVRRKKIQNQINEKVKSALRWKERELAPLSIAVNPQMSKCPKTGPLNRLGLKLHQSWVRLVIVIIFFKNT